MAAPNLVLSDITFARLQELARWAGVSIDEAVDRAIREQYDYKFWQAVNAGYAALRADPVAWAEVQQERRSIEGTLLDGLARTEQWTEDRETAAPQEQGQTS